MNIIHKESQSLRLCESNCVIAGQNNYVKIRKENFETEYKAICTLFGNVTFFWQTNQRYFILFYLSKKIIDFVKNYST